MVDLAGLASPHVRRIPLSCAIRVRVPETRETYYGMTRALSVDDVHFELGYVPRFGQVLEVCIKPPGGGGPFQPLRALVEVYRCERREDDPERYRVGGAIRQILA